MTSNPRAFQRPFSFEFDNLTVAKANEKDVETPFFVFLLCHHAINDVAI